MAWKENYKFTKDDLIRLRKIRDSIGVMLQSPNLNSSEKELLRVTLRELMKFDGMIYACSDEGHGITEADKDLGADSSWQCLL